MQIADFDFDLPEELIAQFPPAVRGGSRLLHVEATGTLHDRWFSDLPGRAPGASRASTRFTRSRASACICCTRSRIIRWPSLR